METTILISLAMFAMIALAARQIGQYFARARLPLITGYLFAGLLAGPFVLGLVPAEIIDQLRFVDEFSLAYIAFAAGSELYLPELRGRLRSIGWVTVGLVISTMVMVTGVVFLLTEPLTFMQGLTTNGRVAAAILAASILVARSPSSAIAIVNEVRAKGPFTRMALGVTVIMDFVVIALFGLSSSIVDAVLSEMSLNAGFVALLLVELILIIGLAIILYRLLEWILSQVLNSRIKIILILLSGFGTFLLSDQIRVLSHAYLPIELLLEPLMICLIASFLLNNRSRHRSEYVKLLHEVGPVIYIAFFTLTGASLEISILLDAWRIGVALFVARFLAVVFGSFIGGTIAGDPLRSNRVKWMAFITQAGVGLGLAKEAAVEFPQLGDDFATLIIAVVVMNEIVGPLFFKWVLNHLGEAHERAPGMEFDGVRDALIFGVDDQALAVTRQLQAHNWQVKLACLDKTYLPQLGNGDITVAPLFQLDHAGLEHIGAAQVDAIVTMLSDEENYRICELFFEHYGIDTMVVRLNDRNNFEQFHELGALIVEPGTAIVSLLDHFVRSPSAASLILGTDPDQDMIDIEVCDPVLDGMPIRDLRLPLDALIMSVHRDGHTIVSHGYTRLRLHDKVTVVGSHKSLEEVILKFEA